MSAASAEAFRALHVPGRPFVMPNAWDRGSARVLAGLGAAAVATSSAAHAFTLGRPDGGRVTRDEAMAHIADLASAVAVPVSADLENGYGRDPETVAETVRLAAEAGAVSGSVEDTDLPGHAPYDATLAAERIAAAAEAARAVPGGFVLCARADGVMLGSYGMAEAIGRCEAFARAGADVLYVPAPPDGGALRELCAVGPPVNALAAGAWCDLTSEDFAEIGVARVSLGSTLARLTHRALLDGGRAAVEGRFPALAHEPAADEIDALLGAS